MCGIFALLASLHTNDSSNIYSQIEPFFLKGQSRGPEFSTMEHFNRNLFLGFHRLAINGLDKQSNQPICIKSNDNTDTGIYLICNGEIYNYKSIYNQLGVTPNTNSDCESILHLYKKYGIKYTLENLDGVFAFVLYDSNINTVFVARDPFGVRPLYYGETKNKHIVFSSLLKQVSGLCDKCDNFRAGTYMAYSINNNDYTINIPQTVYTTFNYNHKIVANSIGIDNNELSSYYAMIYTTLVEAVKKRVITMERNLACLLSGGLDSSLISAIVSKFVPKGQLQTYSIGMSGGSDLKYAKMVSNHIDSKHTEIILSDDDFFSAIPDVIYNIESYDTTSVRASVGNYLVAKYISEISDAKVIFNGDGSDELTGGYMYFHNCPSDIEFDYECKRLLSNLQYYDVLRSDRCISCHGLEPRTPFLDKTFVHEYLSLPISIRNHNNNNNNNNNIEKYLLRQSVNIMDPSLLPKDVLWRTKEAFSDGVSSQENSWYTIIQSKLDDKYTNEEFIQKCSQYTINPPTTKEQLYYREVFESYYPNQGHVIPAYWMPRYCDVTDSSARQLDVYKKKNGVASSYSSSSYSSSSSSTKLRTKLTIDVDI
jgi:asparagine synthase (glutamine-hydrolysing)